MVRAIRQEPSEIVFESETVVVRRLNGRARDGVDGHHRKLVAYTSATVSVGEIVRLLRDVADGLEKTLPRFET